MAKANHTPPVTPPPAARRSILLGALMALAAPKAATAAPVTVERIDAAAQTLAETLGGLHGERWSVTVDHENGFVLMLRGGAK